MNVDQRGVIRGKCLAGKCDCAEYERQAENTKCCYCECPAPKHENLGNGSTVKNNIQPLTITRAEYAQPVARIQPSTSVAEYVQPVAGKQPSTSVAEDFTVIDSATTSTVCQVKPVMQVVSAFQEYLPKKFPKDVEVALEKKQVTPTIRCKIVRIIADLCYANEATTGIVDAVADIAVQKWSPLKSKFGHQSKALAASIKRRMSRLRSYSTKRKFHEQVADSYAAPEMVAEMQKSQYSIQKLKDLMTSVRTKRMEDANCMSAAEHLKVYPALKVEELLLWEFTQITTVSEDVLEARWYTFLKKMCVFIAETQDICINSEDKDDATLQILGFLPKLVKSGKKTNERCKNVVEVFKGNILIPGRTEAPRLIVKEKRNQKYVMAFVDGSPIFIMTSIYRAVFHLIALYWVFNIEFPVEARPSFLLISAVLLQKQTKMMSLLQKCSSVGTILEQLDLLS